MLLLLLLLLHLSNAQLNPCGDNQCPPEWTTGDTYNCFASGPVPGSVTDPFELANWVNCSAVLPDNWKFVKNAAFASNNDGRHAVVPKDFCGDYWWTHGYQGLSYKNWLQKNPTLVSNKKCHDIIKTALCTMNVAPYDVEGKPNTYAWRGHSDTGGSACRSVCYDFWDACNLYDKTAAASYTQLAGFGCMTPYTTDAQRYVRNTKATLNTSLVVLYEIIVIQVIKKHTNIFFFFIFFVTILRFSYRFQDGLHPY